MGDDGISDISAGAGKGVGGMVNGTGLTSGSIARSGAYGGSSSMGVETRIDNELAEVGGLVRRSWVDGSKERIWKLTLRMSLTRLKPE